MESVGSNSPVSDAGPAASSRYRSDQYVADRIIRAFGHRLRLLHRSGPDFFVLGATGNVYKVTLSSAPSCTCPDRNVPCKHILFVLLRVIGLSFEDACIWQRTLRQCQLERLLSTPFAAQDVMAGARARERFHQLFSGNGEAGCPAAEEEEDEGGAVCPICLEEMDAGEAAGLSTCGTCGNSLHSECLARWKRNRGRRGTTCVVCRARWREKREQERYVNLAGYLSEDEPMAEAGTTCDGS